MPQTKEQRYKAKLLAKGYVRRSYILPPCVAAMVAADIVRYMAEYNAANPPPDKPQSPA
jgi:hypothetical protein